LRQCTRVARLVRVGAAASPDAPRGRALARVGPPRHPARPARRAALRAPVRAVRPRRGALVVTSLTILMPVYNESATVLAAIEDALTAELPVERRELIVVDDGSTDGTRAILRSVELPANARIFEHDRNRGKGAALRTGLEHATGEYTAVLDADLEYRAADLGT